MASYDQGPSELGGGVRPTPHDDGPTSFRHLISGRGRSDLRENPDLRHLERSRSDRRTQEPTKGKGKRAPSRDPSIPRAIAKGYRYNYDKQCYIDVMGYDVDEHGYRLRPPPDWQKSFTPDPTSITGFGYINKGKMKFCNHYKKCWYQQKFLHRLSNNTPCYI